MSASIHGAIARHRSTIAAPSAGSRTGWKDSTSLNIDLRAFERVQGPLVDAQIDGRQIGAQQLDQDRMGDPVRDVERQRVDRAGFRERGCEPAPFSGHAGGTLVVEQVVVAPVADRGREERTRPKRVLPVSIGERSKRGGGVLVGHRAMLAGAGRPCRQRMQGPVSTGPVRPVAGAIRTETWVGESA